MGNRRVTGLHFWSRGYCVSTVGLDEETIRKYIREQEKIVEDQIVWVTKYRYHVLQGDIA
jgi:putative transposase